MRLYAKATIPAESLEEAVEIVEHSEVDWKIAPWGRPVFGWASFFLIPVVVCRATWLVFF